MQGYNETEMLKQNKTKQQKNKTNPSSYSPKEEGKMHIETVCVCFMIHLFLVLPSNFISCILFTGIPPSPIPFRSRPHSLTTEYV